MKSRNNNKRNNKNKRTKSRLLAKARTTRDYTAGVERPYYVFGNSRRGIFRWITITQPVYTVNNFLSFFPNNSQNFLILPYQEQQEFVAMGSLYREFKVTKVRITAIPTEITGITTPLTIGTTYISLYEENTKQDANLCETETGMQVPAKATTNISKVYLFRGTSYLCQWGSVGVARAQGPVVYIDNSLIHGPSGLCLMTIRFEIGVEFRQPIDV
jgi:hypothetical protein